MTPKPHKIEGGREAGELIDWEKKTKKTATEALADFHLLVGGAMPNLIFVVKNLLLAQQAKTEKAVLERVREMIGELKVMLWGYASENPTPGYIKKDDLLSKLSDWGKENEK